MIHALNLAKLLGCLAFACSIGISIGCEQPPAASESAAHDEHDHGAHSGHGHAEHHDEEEPASFDEAFAELTSMTTSICKAFIEETPDDAHDALHDVGHLLEELPDLAAKVEEISEEKLARVESAVEVLFDGFGQLDATLHPGGGEVDVTNLEKQLTDAINEIRSTME